MSPRKLPAKLQKIAAQNSRPDPHSPLPPRRSNHSELLRSEASSRGHDRYRDPNPTTAEHPKKSGGWLKWVIILLCCLGAVYWYTHRASNQNAASGPAGGGRGAGGPVPIVEGKVVKKDVPIYLDGLGTVLALNTVTIRTRVDGQLEKIAFTEGQDVKAGDVLAIIDQAPYKAALSQAQGKLAQDQAQLTNAKLDYERYADLVAKKVISSQQYDTQKNLVAQYEGTVRNDTAAVESAKVNLSYTTIVSPLDGRTGIRLVDQGNIVHATDTTGLVVITQLHPIAVIFTLPEQNLTQIHEHTARKETLPVLAVDRDSKTTLDKGELAVIDNQIDTTTGTIKLKALFENPEFRLWPGQFLNARLLVDSRKDGLVVPASVVQRGPNGPYAFVVKDDQTVELRPVKIGQIDAGEALIDEGLAEGETVVVDGQYKLQPGSKVVVGPGPGAAGAPGGHGGHSAQKGGPTGSAHAGEGGDGHRPIRELK